MLPTFSYYYKVLCIRRVSVVHVSKHQLLTFHSMIDEQQRRKIFKIVMVKNIFKTEFQIFRKHCGNPKHIYACLLFLFLQTTLYSYWLYSRKTTGFRQQIRSQVKQNCCCPRSQSITVLLYTFIFSKFSKLIHSFHSHIHKMFSILRQYHMTYWTNENKAIGQQFESWQ